MLYLAIAFSNSRLLTKKCVFLTKKERQLGSVLWQHCIHDVPASFISVILDLLLL